MAFVGDLGQKEIRQLSRQLEAAQAKFRSEVEALAETARTEILPYFKKHAYDFRAGNGSWIISRPATDGAAFYRPEDHLNDEELPANIRALLTLEVAVNDHLGFYIRDINRGE